MSRPPPAFEVFTYAFASLCTLLLVFFATAMLMLGVHSKMRGKDGLLDLPHPPHPFFLCVCARERRAPPPPSLFFLSTVGLYWLN